MTLIQTKAFGELDGECGLSTVTLEGLTWHRAHVKVAPGSYLIGIGETPVEALSNMRTRLATYAEMLSHLVTDLALPVYRKAKADRLVNFFDSVTRKKEDSN